MPAGRGDDAPAIPGGAAAMPGHGEGPRDRMVRSAVALIARDGWRATGMREVADHAGAPRGSIRHYFPGGKDQLTTEALTWMGAMVFDKLEHAASAPVGANRPARSGPARDSSMALPVLQTFVQLWRRSLNETGMAAGCSVAAVVHDVDDPDLLARAGQVFRSWRQPFHDALIADGLSAHKAETLATAVLAALEGAVILCRAEHDLTPLDHTAAVLRDLLRGAGRH